MIELWHCPDARSFRPLWLLEEMGLPYRLHLLPFPPRWQQPDYLATNPLGTIPYLRDGDAELTESTGILHWLVSRHAPTPLAVDPSEPDFALYVNYLFQSDATFTFPQTLVLRYRLLEPPEKRQPAVADSYAKWFLARMTWVETHLAQSPSPRLRGEGRGGGAPSPHHIGEQAQPPRQWLAANRFTIADIAVGYACLLAATLGLEAQLGPLTRAWWARCQARDGYRRARAAQRSPT